jgi:hypothetical protein
MIERKTEPAGEPDELVQQLEQEQQALELPAREAFSLVWSSPTFLHAEGMAEQILPEEPAGGLPPDGVAG